MTEKVERAYNFNAGPAALPLEVLQKAQSELTDYRGIGMSVMEISHRSEQYEQINRETQQLFAELLALPPGYKVLFMQGGASTQFALVPMNLLTGGKTAHYIVGGSWAAKAVKEAAKIGQTKTYEQPKPYIQVPDFTSLNLDEESAYVHVTSNETIDGIQYREFPDTGHVPLVADMSSDILSRPLDVSRFSLIYAGAQKNLGPSGVTVVIIRESLLDRIPDHLPTMFRYDTHVSADSLYNTPPAFSVYMMKLVLEWIREQGGLDAMEQRNRQKAELLYHQIDASGGFYNGTVEKDSRSHMSVTFRLPDESLEREFLQLAASKGFVGLKGHRSVGGLRASLYNAVPLENCQALATLMEDFRRTHS